MDTMCRIQGSVPSQLDTVNDFLSGAMRQIAVYITDPDLIFDIKLILNELVINGAMHGNKWNESKKVFLNIHLTDDRIQIIVRDEGEGINFSTEEYDYKDMKSNGRGLVLVEALTDNFICQGNEVIVNKYY